MEMPQHRHSPVVDDLAFSKLSEAQPDSMQQGKSHDQPGIDDEKMLLDQDSHRTHVTETQINEPDLHSQILATDSREDSPMNIITNAPLRSASQQSQFKATFTRPVSSEGVIQTGFVFEKAPPPKALNLTGGRKPATIALTKPYDPISHQSFQLGSNSSQIQHQDGSNPLASVACNSNQVRQKSPPSGLSKMPIEDSNAQKTKTAPQGLHEDTPINANHGPHHTVQESLSDIPKDILPILRTAYLSSRANVIQLGTAQQQQQSVPETGSLPIQTAQDRAGINSLPLQKIDAAGNVTGSSLRQLRTTHNAQNGVHIPTINTAQESIQPGRKVTKRKSTTKKKSVAGNAPVQSVEALSVQDSATSIIVPPPTVEDQFIDAIWLRYKTQLDERRVEKGQLEFATAELQRAREVNGMLRTRLDETQRFAEKHKAELAENKLKMVVWQTKLGKLTEHISGLSKDHTKLEQDSICIRTRQEEISKDKASMNVTMKEVHQYVKDGKLAELNAVKKEAEHRIRLLEQTVENQERQLDEDWDLLRAERERNVRLEAEIVNFSDKHDELMKDVVAHRQTISTQLSELLMKREEHQAASNSDNDSLVGIQVEECANLLKKLCDSDNVTSSDFQKLNSSVRNYAEQITKAIERGIQTTISAGTGLQTFESELQSKLDSLNAGLKSEQTLGEQVAELRELKATIKERLQASEVALAEARQYSNGLQQREQLLQRRISDLEVETATLRSQPTENLLAVLRQKELEDKNTQLLADIMKANDDAREAAELARGQAQSLVERGEQINCLNAQLEELQAALTSLGNENSAFEQRAEERYDAVRDQVFKAAEGEKTYILNAHANSMRQLEYQKDEASTRAEELSCQLAALRNAEGNKSETSSKLRAQCANLEIQNAEKDSRLASLQEIIRHAAEATQSKDAAFEALCGAKTRLAKEIQSQEAEIEALRKTNAELVQQHKSTKENSAATLSDADVKAAQTLAEVQILLGNFDENLVLANTLSDAMTDLSQVLISAKKDRRKVLDTESAAANSKAVLSSSVKLSEAASGSPEKPRRKVNRGVSQENVDKNEYQSGLVVQRSEVEETTTHSKNVKTTFSSLGTDKFRITPFSQIRQIEPSVPLSYLGDTSELFPPTPIKEDAQPNYPPLQEAQRLSQGTHAEVTQKDGTRESTKIRPARRATAQGPHLIGGPGSDRIASKRVLEGTRRTPNAETPTRRAEKRSTLDGRNVVFDDPTATSAALGRMKTSQTHARPASSKQVPPSPRGILKDSNTLKRSAAAAGLNGTVPDSRASKSTKVNESKRNSLGPIIGDSQSPRKTKRRNSGRKASKEQEYSDRFSQELK